MSDGTSSGQPVSVTFVTLGGAELPAMVERFVSSEVDGGEERCTMRFSLDWEVFQRALADEAFNLFPRVILGDGLSSLEPGRAVVIEAELRPVVLRGLGSQAAALEPGSLPDGSVVLRAESWLALTLTQAVELPEEIGGGAHAEVGCRTSWSLPPGAAASGDTIAGVASATLRELGHPVDALDAGLFRAVVTRGDRSWVLLVHADEQARTCVLWSVYPRPAAADQRAAVAQYLIEGNYELSIGSFEMDPGDGEIRFRTSIDVGTRPLAPELFERLLARNLEGMTRAWPMLAEYLRD
jgi:hypothetical protein